MNSWFIQEMPIDKDGKGPAGDDYTVATLWEIWDGHDMSTIASFKTKEAAEEFLKRCRSLMP